MAKLLDGAREVASTNIFRREYVKPGGVDRAMRDFYSVNPKNVQSISGNNIVSVTDN